MRILILTILLIFPILLQAQNNSFTVEQLGKPLKEVITNFEIHKNLKPVYVSDYGTVEYRDVPFSNRKGLLTVYAFDSLVYRFDYSFFPIYYNSNIEDGTALYNEMRDELIEKYGKANFSDPYHRYGLGKDYLKVAYWETNKYIIKLNQDYETNLVALTYTYTKIFDVYIADLLNKRKAKKQELLKDY